MNICVSYQHFSEELGGGARISIHSLLNGLKKENNKYIIDVFQSSESDLKKPGSISNVSNISLRQIPKLWWMNQIYIRKQWKKKMKNELRSKDYDLIITQGKVAPATVEICKKTGIDSIFFVRSLRLAGFKNYKVGKKYSEFNSHTVGDLLQYPFLRQNRREYTSGIQNADVVISNSNYTKNAVSDIFDVDSKVIFPPIIVDKYKTKYDPNGKITMVNPRAEHKGADIFLKVAERLPDENFLMAGEISSKAIKNRLAKADNVEHQPWTNDMKNIYGRSKVLVVPSRFEEPFGRVAAEAMCSGIPCVVSDRGGLPEVVSDTGVIVSEIESPNKWISAIRRAINTHNPSAQMERVNSKFSLERQITKLERIIDNEKNH